MKILLTHYYTRKNFGDAAIVSSMISEFRRNYDAEIMLSTMESKAERVKFESVSTYTSFFYESIYRNTNFFYRIINTIQVMSTTFIWVLLYRRFNITLNIILNYDLKKLLNLYKNADLIVAVGGGYYKADGSFNSFISHILNSYTIIIGVLLKKKIVMYSQSIGPFNGYLANLIAKYTMNKVNLIMVRENISKRIINELNVNKPKVIRSVDCAFLFKSIPKNSKTLNILNKVKSSKQKIVGITVKKCLSHKEQNIFNQEIALFADILIKKYKMKVVFLPQVTATLQQDNDFTVINSILSMMKYSDRVIKINDMEDHYVAKIVYSKLNYLIATRMHSAIFALTNIIPTIALAYEHKTTGIMKDLYLDEWVINVKNVKANTLEEYFVRLCNEDKVYKRELIQSISKYQTLALKDISNINNYLTFNKNI